MTWGDTRIDRRTLLGGTAAGVGAGLAGCANQGGPTDGEDGDGAGEQDGDAEDIQEGGTVVVGQSSDLQSFNIWSTGNEFGQTILDLIYERGLRFSPSERPIPGVFREWEVNVDNFGTDDPAVVATMLEGHTFSDGEEVTAGDVAFTHQYMEEQGTENIYQTPSYFEDVQADAEDGYTVSWFFSEVASDAVFRGPGQLIVPKHIWQDVADYTEYNPHTEGELIGSGPFVIGETNQGEFYEVIPRPKEEIPWNGMDTYPWLHPDGPFIDGVRVEIFQSEAAEFQAILDDQINLPVGGQTLEQAIQASQDDTLDVIESGTPSWVMDMYNLRRVPLDDVAFRQFLHKCYNQRWTVETQLQNIAGEKGEWLVAKPWEFWRPPEVRTMLEEADSDDPYAPTQYVNEKIADEDIVEPVDIPDLRYPGDSAEWPTPDQSTVDELRDFLLNHPKAEHDYSLGPAESEGTDSVDGQEIYVNGDPMGRAHTNNAGQPGQGPIEFNDYPPNLDPTGFERNTKIIKTVQATGVPTTRSSQPWPSTQPKVYQEENFDVMRQSWPNRRFLVTHLSWMLSGTSNQLDFESTESTTNWNGAGYQGADEMVARQDGMIELERRQPWVKQILAQVYHDQPQSVEVYARILQTVDTKFTGYVQGIGGVFSEDTLLNLRLAGESG